ncbi:165_t:CDS:2, partial [Dentiscutata erythropus]
MLGICKKCEKTEYSDIAWCKSCDPVNSVRTGNDEIDKFLQRALLSAKSYGKVVEWIQFNRLEDIKFIGQGGFSNIFSATWIDGERKDIEEEGEIRGKKLKVALKLLNNSENITKAFLNEIEKDISIRNEFIAADKIARNEIIAANKIVSNPSSSQIHPNAIYTSRLLSKKLDLENLPEPKNST